MSCNSILGISGIIGAGKTTLATHLGKVLDVPVYYEPVIDNEYLADFYADMKKYSFPLQIYLLNKRFRQHQQIIWQGKGGVQDRFDSLRLSVHIAVQTFEE
jgi:deoxyadenosine kinase